MSDKKKRRLTTVCSICSGPSASHLHYGAVACYSCRAFFRRGIGKPYCCVEGTGDCNIDWTCRRSCQWCRFDRCLKAGMKPELVDAAFRRKGLHKKVQNSFETPTLIDNFQPLERHDISDLLQDYTDGSSQSFEETAENIYFLESEAELFNLQYNLAPASVDTFSSPSHSLSSSLSPSSSAASSFSDYGDMSGEGACYTININISDIENQMFSLPEGLYQNSHQRHPDVSMMEMEDCEDSDVVRNDFDIEALVDECFLSRRKDDTDLMIQS